MIEHFTLRTITDKVIVQRAAHFNRMHAEELPDDPLADPRDAVTRMRRLPAATRQHTWVVRDRGCIRAQASLAWTEREENRRLAHVYVSVERQLRRRGIGAQLLSLTLVEAIRAAVRSSCRKRRIWSLPAGALSSAWDTERASRRM